MKKQNNSSSYYQNKYNEGVADEYVCNYGSGCSSKPFTTYTEIDEEIDKQIQREEEWSAILKGYHDFKWAVLKASEYYHLTCDLLEPDERLVYCNGTVKIRRYNKFGITISIREPTDREKRNKTWREFNARPRRD